MFPARRVWVVTIVWPTYRIRIPSIMYSLRLTHDRNVLLSRTAWERRRGSRCIRSPGHRRESRQDDTRPALGRREVCHALPIAHTHKRRKLSFCSVVLFLLELTKWRLSWSFVTTPQHAPGITHITIASCADAMPPLPRFVCLTFRHCAESPAPSASATTSRWWRGKWRRRTG